jgi:hypothetical protein
MIVESDPQDSLSIHPFIHQSIRNRGTHFQKYTCIFNNFSVTTIITMTTIKTTGTQITVLHCVASLVSKPLYTPILKLVLTSLVFA